jgi:Zn-dependent protease with chaperone function
MPLPPWLWVWLITFGFFHLPNELRSVSDRVSRLFGGIQIEGRDIPLGGIFQLPILMITGAVLLGLLTVLLPWARAAYLEKRFRLTALPQMSPALKDIAGFVHEHAPEIEVKGNLLRTDHLAFVYPIGYRKRAMAIFGGVVRLWRSDRKAAEAVILHEVAHSRNGDVLIVGAGSLFTTLVRYIPLLGILSLLIDVPAYSIAIVGTLDVGDVAAALLRLVPKLWPYLIVAMMATLLAPVTAIWCAEFNADRFAVQVQGTNAPLVGVLDKLPQRASWWRWLIFRITHPPDRMRKWMITKTGGLARPIFLLLLFPIAAVLGGFLIEVQSAWGLVVNSNDAAGGDVFAARLVSSMNRVALYCVVLAALIALWPVLARYWAVLFTEHRSGERTLGGVVNRNHLIGAGVLAVISGLYFSAVRYYEPLAKYDLPEAGWLPPGEYSTGIFRPAMSFEVGPGWWADPEEEKYDVLTLQTGKVPEGQMDGAVRFQNVHEVFRADLTVEDVTAASNHEDAPDDMVEWFQEHPYVDTTRLLPITVGGAPGVHFDVSISESYAPQVRPSYPACTTKVLCLPLFYHGEGSEAGWYALFGPEGLKYKVIVVDVASETVVIVVNAPDDNFVDFLRQAAKVLGTVSWERIKKSEQELPEKSKFFKFPESELLRIPRQGPLPPGEYMTDEFEPTLSFNVGEDWFVNNLEAKHHLTLRNESRWLAFANITEVYDPRDPGLDKLSAAPEDLAAWLEKHPYLDTEKPVPVTVQGAKGLMVDTKVSTAPENYSPHCSVPCVPLFKLDRSPYWLQAGYQNRIILLRVEGKMVAIVFESPDEEFDEYLPKAEAVLNSVKWRG